MNSIQKIKQEIAEKYGFETWDGYVEHYQDEDRPGSQDFLHITEHQLNEFIQWALDLGYNHGMNDANNLN